MAPSPAQTEPRIAPTQEPLTQRSEGAANGGTAASSVTAMRRGRVLLVTLENPPLALMDETMVEGIAAVAERVKRDPGIGAVVLTGSHPSRFVAHYDVGELLDVARSGPSLSPRPARVLLRAAAMMRRLPAGGRFARHTPLAGVTILERIHEVMLGIERSPAVWVAALNGSALGGGCELALACDLRLMAAGEHVIGQPEIMLGITPGGGGTQRLARLLGPSRALRLLLDGRPLSPEQAAGLGVVDEVIAADQLLDAAVDEAARLAKRPKAAIGGCKRAVYGGGSLPLEQGLLVERSEFLSTLGTRDAQRAMAAYVEATRAGDLPAYDPAAVAEAIAHGRFEGPETANTPSNERRERAVGSPIVHRLQRAVVGANKRLLTALRSEESASVIDMAVQDAGFSSLHGQKHCLVVTYRRDGRPVAQPVWPGYDGERIYIWTEIEAYKAKRLRNNADALIAPCSFRGKPLGPPIAARGRILESDAERNHAERVIRSQWGWKRKTYELTARPFTDVHYIELVPAADQQRGPATGG
jgi:PPOX class probable F420-dependent enzyme